MSKQQNELLRSTDRQKQKAARFFSSEGPYIARDALEESSLGKFLCSFKPIKKLKTIREPTLTASALYRYSGAEKAVLYKDELSAPMLGHEFRHAWQRMFANKRTIRPRSVEEHVLMWRFYEADARAVQMGINAQLIGASSCLDKKYRVALEHHLGDYQREAFAHNRSRLIEAGRDSDSLKNRMRYAFDLWMALAPGVEDYETGERSLIEERQLETPGGFRGFLERFFFNRPFSHTGVRPVFVEKLVKSLGTFSADGSNYLTETKGMDFNDPFYTRVCNFRLERLIPSERPAQMVFSGQSPAPGSP